MSTDHINSISRAMELLECFSGERSELSLRELSEQMQLPTTTIFRILGTLCDLRYLEKDALRKTYRIGPQLMMLSGAIYGRSDLNRAANAEMERLSSVLNETINLVILDGYEIFYLNKVETRRSIRCNTQIGNRLPAHMAGCGKVLLSGMPAAFIDEYWDHMSGLPPMTGTTIVTKDRLLAELSDIRRLGYGVDNGESEPGLNCFAAPVFDATDQMIAAISVAGPDYRMVEERETMISEVKRSAYNISRMLGFLR